MGSFTKWLGAGLGFTLGGPIGAAIGFALGSVVDNFSEKDIILEQREYQRRVQSEPNNINTTPGDFEISLLVLASIVIKADGKVDERELDFVRNQFVSLYGKERANNAFKLFKGIVRKKIATREVCIQIRQYMSHASRLQLIHFLFGIAKADGVVTENEVETIRRISGYLYINHLDFESIKGMFYDLKENAYKILEIDDTATDAEVKKAFRRMAKKYHPDKVHELGEEHKQGAKEKFLSIQKAYETIKKERGMN